MSANLARAVESAQAPVADRRGLDRSPDGDQSLAARLDVELSRVRRAVAECGYTHDALAAAMVGRPDRSYVTKVLDGDKPLSDRFRAALPADVRCEMARDEAESHGLIVAAPVDFETAARHLVSGLLGVLAPQFPARASGMVKASIRRRP